MLPFGGSSEQEEPEEQERKLSTSRCCSAWMGRNDRKGRERGKKKIKEKTSVSECESKGHYRERDVR